MKKVFLICILAINIASYAQNGVAINTTGAAANNNAMLDVSATNKGLLAPRVNLVSLTGDVVTSFGISGTPTTSLLVYNTTASAVFQTGFYFWDGSLWTKLNTGATSSVANAWSLTGNASTTASNYIGTTDALPLSLRTAGLDRMSITSTGNVGIGSTAPSSKLTVNGEGFFANIPITLVGTAGNFTNGGVLRTSHSEGSGFFTNNYNLKMDGYRIQAEANSILLSPGPSSLYLNPFGGRVGIGTKTTPNAALEVKGNSIVTRPTLSLTDTIATNYARLQFKNTNSPSYWHIAGLNNTTNSTERLNFYNSTSGDVMSITGDGKVGIGTTNPGGVKLAVVTAANDYGISHNDGTIQIGTYLSTAADIGGQIGTVSNHPLGFFANNSTAQMTLLQNGNFGIGTTTPTRPLSFPATFGKKISLYPGGSGDLGMAVFGNELRFFSDYAGADITFGYDHYTGGFTERMRVKGNGNVGIGTNNPAEKLVVNTLVNKAGLAHTDGTIQFVTFLSNDIDFGGQIGTTSQHPLRFFAGNNYAEATLLPNGNFGIGTLNPSHKLSVNGTIRSKEVIVETGWADFVFDKKYKLPSLFEVEKFIAENQHLPNIPSAEEIQKNGLKVGEVQTKMMQKIEELTLYVIELKKEIEALKIKK